MQTSQAFSPWSRHEPVDFPHWTPANKLRGKREASPFGRPEWSFRSDKFRPAQDPLCLTRSPQFSLPNASMLQQPPSPLSQLLGRRGEVCYGEKEFIAYQLCEQTQTYWASVNWAKSMKHQSSNLTLYFLQSEVLLAINVIWNSMCETVKQKRNENRMWLYVRSVPCWCDNTFKILISVESWPQALHQSVFRFVMCSVWFSVIT